MGLIYLLFYNLTRLAEGRVLEATITNSWIHIHSGTPALGTCTDNLTNVHWTCGAPCTLQQSLDLELARYLEFKLCLLIGESFITFLIANWNTSTVGHANNAVEPLSDPWVIGHWLLFQNVVISLPLQTNCNTKNKLLYSSNNDGFVYINF